MATQHPVCSGMIQQVSRAVTADSPLEAGSESGQELILGEVLDQFIVEPRGEACID